MNERINRFVWSNVIFMVSMYMLVGYMDKGYITLISIIGLLLVSRWIYYNYNHINPIYIFIIIAIDIFLIIEYYSYRSDFYSIQLVTGTLLLLVAITGKVSLDNISK